MSSPQCNSHYVICFVCVCVAFALGDAATGFLNVPGVITALSPLARQRIIGNNELFQSHTYTHTHTHTRPTPNTSCSLADVCKRNCRPVPPLIISSSSSSSLSPLRTLQTASSSPHFMSFFPHPCLLPPLFFVPLSSCLFFLFSPRCLPSLFSLPPCHSSSSLPPISPLLLCPVLSSVSLLSSCLSSPPVLCPHRASTLCSV